jgi:hypothetical protein
MTESKPPTPVFPVPPSPDTSNWPAADSPTLMSLLLWQAGGGAPVDIADAPAQDEAQKSRALAAGLSFSRANQERLFELELVLCPWVVFDWRRVAIRVAGIGRLVVGVGAVHGPAKGGPATGRNPTAREGAPASPKGLKARSPVRQRAGLPAPTPASAGFGLGQELGG